MKLIAIDLDGTLLSDDGTISLENRNAIYEAQKNNNIIVISSGRSLHDTRQILKQADIECPFITGNGAMTYHSGDILQQFIIPLEVLKKIRNAIKKHNLYYEIYTNQGVYIMEEGKDLLYQEIQELDQETDKKSAFNKVDIQYSQHGLIYVSDFHAAEFSTLNPYKVFVLSFNHEKLQELRRDMTKMKDISLTTSGREKLEIAHEQASKGNALKFIADYFNVPLADTFAIGDNLNDISMFEIAGRGIAMENAEEEVKERAAFITKDHNDSGVAYALRNYILT
ncbi:Cof-type HAD-IIB family hydrolase [Lentibacillus sp.]|uniref:Cof-type HAD-IIB family hydrolase n=1 Tax=Lentibacillus sp. TaxID=1925746 RepID=UPI002B4AEFFE|nr:Cof-type HAD-IIB family hydrolase [Lentibacillus sp.]HLS09378.1 Cof-type HAD-IIB family hydrolase [Lentibacillus sp.]